MRIERVSLGYRCPDVWGFGGPTAFEEFFRYRMGISLLSDRRFASAGGLMIPGSVGSAISEEQGVSEEEFG